MGTPKIVQDIRDLKSTYIFTTENDVIEHPELPIDATTLDGHPLEYFASKAEVSETLLTYIRTVLGTTY